MNPLGWKREHRIALLCAIALGVAFGLALGLRWVETCCYSARVHLYCQGPGELFCTDFVPIYWLLVMLCGAAGGAVAAILIYIRQLLRA